MKSKGFTLVELLATIVIIGLIAVIMIPGFTNISNTLKETNRDNKIIMIRHAALDYAENMKDEIKQKEDSEGKCSEVDVSLLIKEGYLSMEKEIKEGSGVKPIVVDPVDNKEMKGPVYICYCSKNYSLIAYYEGQSKSDFCK